jgi:hypothetical protein
MILPDGQFLFFRLAQQLVLVETNATEIALRKAYLMRIPTIDIDRHHLYMFLHNARFVHMNDYNSIFLAIVVKLFTVKMNDFFGRDHLFS